MLGVRGASATPSMNMMRSATRHWRVPLFAGALVSLLGCASESQRGSIGDSSENTGTSKVPPSEVFAEDSLWRSVTNDRVVALAEFFRSLDEEWLTAATVCAGSRADAGARAASYDRLLAAGAVPQLAINTLKAAGGTSALFSFTFYVGVTEYHAEVTFGAREAGPRNLCIDELVLAQEPAPPADVVTTMSVQPR